MLIESSILYFNLKIHLHPTYPVSLFFKVLVS